MKKNTKKKFDPSYGKRIEWKNDAENEIITMQENIDELCEGLDLPESFILDLEKIVDKFKANLNDCIEQFTITPEMVALQDKGELLTDLLDEIYFERIPIGESEIDRMVDIVSDNKTGKGGVFVPIDSMAQEIRLDAFLSELHENPYQLQLIA